MFLSLGGCAADDCSDLCTRTANRIGNCLVSWDVDWTALGATTQADFASQCQIEWDEVRTDLEPRQVESAMERCANTRASLSDLTCDDLRALYL